MPDRRGLGTAASSPSGPDLLRAIGLGALPTPSVMRALGIEPVEVEEGRVAMIELDERA